MTVSVAFVRSFKPWIINLPDIAKFAVVICQRMAAGVDTDANAEAGYN